MRFEVLGPLRVCRGESELDLGFPQQRALLGLLLVRAGRSVPMGEIVDVLWAERPPASAMNVVRRYAGSLRRLLEPGLPPRAPGRRLLRRTGGYLLDAGVDEVDLLRFRDLTRRGKRAVATGRPEVALRHFAGALGEWRGPVATGIPAPVREHAVFAAVEQEFVRTTVMAADAALLCGGTEQVLPRLRQAVALDPMNESLHARLVMTLAATGLQADALAAYEDVRRSLTEELGVAPGAELSAAHTRVLRQELRPGGPAVEPGRDAAARLEAVRWAAFRPGAAGLESVRPGAAGRAGATGLEAVRAGVMRPVAGRLEAVPPGAMPPVAGRLEAVPPGAMPPVAGRLEAVRGDVPEAVVRPARLPPDLKVFSGRRAELAGLLEIAEAAAEDPAGPSPTVLISGMAGVGKTTLAVHWAHEVAHSFPDGRLHVELRGFDPFRAPLEPAEALRGMLTTLGVPARRLPDGLDTLSGLYRSVLSGRRLLILLDGAVGTEQVRPLLTASPDCLTVVTSRHVLPGLIASGAHSLRLDPPSGSDARAVLALRVGQERLSAEPGAVDEIIARCGRLPLALAGVAARATGRACSPPAAIAAVLRDLRGGLDAFSGPGGAVDVRTAFACSYRLLPPESARLFRFLSLHSGPDLGAGAAAALTGLSVRRARIVLGELADAHLVTEHAPGRYAQHELLRVFAAELAEEHDSLTEREAARRRLRDHLPGAQDA
ncbi:BTAD domain-containing putative transcriptional regulator [Streptomyces sp. NPDC046862]|uniref:AfsR/SARP family transcriptional regulator n=1 Tax=Streptomyces sp. NPDC046862 TaxID=3154603 RepID=UPI003456144A